MTKFNVGDEVVVNSGTFQGRTGTVIIANSDSFIVVEINGIQYAYSASRLDAAPVKNEFTFSRAFASDEGVQVSSSDTNLYFYDAGDAADRLKKYERWALAAKAGLRFLTDNPYDPKEAKINALEKKIKDEPKTRAIAEMIYSMTEDNDD